MSGMASPAKVASFLDMYAPRWDGSLLFVFAGALPVSAAGYCALRKRGCPLLCESDALPSTRGIDLRLLCGAAIFGAGWGLLGICPGPAFVYMGSQYQSPRIFAFVSAILVGMVVVNTLVSRRLKKCSA